MHVHCNYIAFMKWNFKKVLYKNFDKEVLIAVGNEFHNFAPKYRNDFKPYCDVKDKVKEKKLWKQSGATMLTDS